MPLDCTLLVCVKTLIGVTMYNFGVGLFFGVEMMWQVVFI
jgi:hypothetical protein